jgi:hypothetical protein
MGERSRDPGGGGGGGGGEGARGISIPSTPTHRLLVEGTKTSTRMLSIIQSDIVTTLNSTV